jgi:hypothetical protein
MPINIHVAEPIWFYQPMDSTNDGLMNAYHWRLDNQPGIVGHQGMIQILERAVKRHPKTTFIACHFANCDYDLTILGDLFDKYPNLYADISARYAETAPIPRFVRIWALISRCIRSPSGYWKVGMNIFMRTINSVITGHSMALD